MSLRFVTVLFGLRFGGRSGRPPGERLRDPRHGQPIRGGDPLSSGERERPVWTSFPSWPLHNGAEESCHGRVKVSPVISVTNYDGVLGPS